MVRRLDAFHDRGRAWGFIVFIALALGLVFPYFEATRNANERPRLLQAMALVDTGTFAIDGPGARRIDPGPDIARSEVDRRLYPNKPPGATIVTAVAYRLARAVHGDDLDLRTYTWWARMFTGLLPTVLLAAFMLRRLARSFSREPAIAAVTFYALGTPAAAYAHLAYGHQLTAALLLVGIALLVDAITLDPTSTPVRTRNGLAFVGGLLAASAVTVEYAAAFAGLPIGIAMLLRLRDRRRIPTVLAGIGGALIPLGLLLAYHDAVFGSPFATGYHHVVVADFAEKHGQGLLGLGVPTWEAFHTHFLSADAGLLPWAPLVVLAIYGLVVASRHADDPTRTEARVYLATFLLYAVIVSGLGFTGGWRVGPRYLVPVLPMLALGFAEAIGQARNRPAWLFTIVALGMYGVIINTLAANLWPHFDVDNIYHPVGEVLLPLWERGLEPHSLPRAWFHVDATHAVIVLTCIGAAMAFARPVELMPSTIVAFVLGGALALLLVVLTREWPTHEKGERNLAYIVKSWEPAPGEIAPTRSQPLPPLKPGTEDRR